MAALGEQIAGESQQRRIEREDQAYTDLLAQTTELSDAMRSFLAGGKQVGQDGESDGASSTRRIR